MPPKLGRPGSITRVLADLCPLPAGPGAALAAALSRWITGVVCRGLSGPLNRLVHAYTCTVVALPPKQKYMDTRCVQMYLVSYPWT